ncbi:MAG TPA: alpha/beta fold hydrolase, partial [Helicobacteraceae bacterium]|nr:alpha/beta fold hydrolase [Helicobacteraceae bacterium]
KLQDSVGVLPKLAQAYPNTRIITFNYRGYGKSQGKPSQATLYHDALAIYDYVHEHYQVNGVLGYSLGSAVASFLGSKRSLQWLVLIAAFDSIQALSKYHYKMHLSVLARHPFETYKHVQSITTPLYLFASKDDNIVPIYNARRLRNNVKNLRVYKEFSGYNHDEILLSDAVVCALKEELEL